MISLEPTYDMPKVRRIVTHPEIWARISDGVDSEKYYPSFDSSNQWILVKDGEEVIGVIYLHCDTSCSIGFHPYLLADHRKSGREMMSLFFGWFLENTEESIVKINVVIPECFPSTVNFARKVGFKDEGVCRNSYTYEDKVYNRVMLGITREEVCKWAA